MPMHAAEPGVAPVITARLTRLRFALKREIGSTYSRTLVAVVDSVSQSRGTGSQLCACRAAVWSGTEVFSGAV